MKHQNLETFAKGALTEQVNRALEEVTRNVQNPNTDPQKVRKIIVTITMKPNEERDLISTSVDTKATLAPTLGAITSLSMGKNSKTGEIECIELAKTVEGE